MTPDTPAAVGIVCDEGRGSLPYQLIHGEALVAAAAWALGQAEVELVDHGVGWENLIAHQTPVVLHDPLCPMTPPEWIAACIAETLQSGDVVVGVRPVTDTVKELVEADLGVTVDRSQLVGISSPVVLPVAVVTDLADGLPTTDFVELVGFLRDRYGTQLVQAPEEARRVASAEDLRVLAALTTQAQ